jgi:hypothetical protein
MTHWKWIGILGIALWATGWMTTSSATASTDEYTIEDLHLDSAGDLLNVCTLDPTHTDYTAGRAFCYGFFEGAIRYARAISDAGLHKALVCAPAGTTRLQAVEVFVTYMRENPQYADEGPIDTVYRALIPRWPCTD